MADKNNADIVFGNIARQYAEVYGNVLLSECAEMRRQRVAYVMPRADSRIHPLIKKRRRKGTVIKIVAAVAAVVVLAISIPSLLSREKMSDSGASPEQDYTTTDTQEETSGIMPLTFVLPQGYAVADSKLDNGQSVYYLDHYEGDDVVLTMEDALAAADYDYGELGTVYIDGTAVSGLSVPDYQILVFEHGGVFYTLSCKYDLGTIVTLYREIVY